MTGLEIQTTLDRCRENDVISLPNGEFEGPFTIKKSCCLEGQNTTLWAKKGPVLVVESGVVTLRSLCLEVTKPPQLPHDFLCLLSKTPHLQVDNVRIFGEVKGVPTEENSWDFPPVLDLGTFPCNTACSFTFEVNLPVAVHLETEMEGLSLSPNQVVAGTQLIELKVQPLEEDTYIYGEVLLQSRFIRRIIVAGKAKRLANTYLPNRKLYTATKAPAAVVPQFERAAPPKPLQATAPQPLQAATAPQPPKPPTQSMPQTVILPVVQNANLTQLIRGQKTAIPNPMLPILVDFSALSISGEMQIDPYVFLIDTSGKVTCEEHLIFFGNCSSPCGSVKYLEQNANKTVQVQLNKVPASVQKISVAYAIYGDNPSDNFSKINNPLVTLHMGQENVTCFYLQDLILERTVVAVEFYRYKDQWKINPVGGGYRQGLVALCESFGLEVM